MNLKITYLILFFISFELKAQVLNGNFESINAEGQAKFWNVKQYTFDFYLDTNGISHSDSVVYDKANVSFNTMRPFSGMVAMELRNGYNFTKNEGLPAVVFASSDSADISGRGNGLIELSSNPDALKFNYSFIPVGNDVAYASIKVYDAFMNEIGFGEVRIESASLNYTEMVIPVDYHTIANAAFAEIKLSTAAEGSTVNLGTVLLIDDVSTVFQTSMEMGPKYNPLDVYPNPAKDNFRVRAKKDFKPSEVVVVDMSGKLTKLVPTTEGVYNVSNFTEGIYIVIISGGGTFSKMKLVVRR